MQELPPLPRIKDRRAAQSSASKTGKEAVQREMCIRDRLGVSRAAVHKAAAALTAQGYALEAASRRGYRLLGGDPFCTCLLYTSRCV